MPLIGNELNRLSDDIVSADGNVYIHSASPVQNNAAGTANRIPNVDPQPADADTWSDAANGDVVYGANLDYGVLAVGAATTVRYWSFERGGSVRAYEEVHDRDGNLGVTVPAGDSFRLLTGTVRINGSTS